MRPRFRLLWVSVALALGAACGTAPALPESAPSVPAPAPVVAILPFEGVDPADVDAVRDGIAGMFRADVRVLAAAALPPRAYYPPRRRYRANTLLEHLEASAGPEVAKVVGLTRADISVTKGDVYDWGIFGLGSAGGRPCVVSGYRLGSGGASRNLYLERLRKVANHEVGHTFGLPHCLEPGCLMRDAGGRIATVDAEPGRFCGTCAAALSAMSVLGDGA